MHHLRGLFRDLRDHMPGEMRHAMRHMGKHRIGGPTGITLGDAAGHLDTLLHQQDLSDVGVSGRRSC